MVSTRNVLVSAASLVAVAQALTVNTPASAVQCQPVALSWGEGSAPFYVSIIPGGQPSAAALENLPTQTGMTYTWMVDIDAGTSITVKVVDSTGAVNYSDQITVQQGTTTDCAASSGGAVAGGASSSAAAGSSDATSSAASRAASSAGGSSSAALASGRTPLSGSTTGSSAASRSTGAASSGVSSGVGANAAATTSSTGAAKMGASVGFSLLGAGLLFALAA